jgi:hypothetical protein
MANHIIPPTASDIVHPAIPIDVQWDGREIVKVLINGFYIANQVMQLKIWPLIPVVAGDDVKRATAIYVKGTGRFIPLGRYDLFSELDWHRHLLHHSPAIGMGPPLPRTP